MSWLNVLEIGLAAFFGSAATGVIAYFVYKGTMEENFRNHIQNIQDANKRHEENLKVQTELQKKNVEDIFKLNREITVIDIQIRILLEAITQLNELKINDVEVTRGDLEHGKKIWLDITHFNMNIQRVIAPAIALFNDKRIPGLYWSRDYAKLRTELYEARDFTKINQRDYFNKLVEMYAKNLGWIRNLISIFTNYVNELKGKQ